MKIRLWNWLRPNRRASRPRLDMVVRGAAAAGAALLLAGVAVAQDPPRATLVATVTRVNDGDSLEVQLESGTGRVRLSAIDTPEYDQPYGTESSDAMKALLPVGTKVKLEVITQDQFR